MKNDLKIEFNSFCDDDFDEFLEMVFALYKKDAYGEKINIQKIKKTISILSNSSDKGDIYIFKSETYIVGYAITIYYWSNEYGSYILFIDEIYVKPDFRRQGISTQFIDFLININKRKMKAIQLEVTKANRIALNFYQKNGFIINENQSLIKLF